MSFQGMRERMKLEKTLYRREKGKSIHVRSRFTLSKRGMTVYKIVFITFFAIILLLFKLEHDGIIGTLASFFLFFGAVIFLIVFPIILAFMEKGKEAFLKELNENKVTTISEIDVKESVFGGSYDNTKITVISNNNGSNAMADDTDPLKIEDHAPLTVIDETKSEN